MPRAPLRLTVAPRPVRRRAGLGALLAPLLVAGCASGAAKVTLVCPGAAVLATAAHLTAFRPGGAENVRDLALTALMKPPFGVCTRAGRGMMRVRAQVSLTAARGPGARGRRATIAYFVAVTRGEAILSKTVVPVGLVFPPGVDQLAVTGRRMVFEVPLSADGSAAGYQVLAGFQLSPAELAYNRRHPAP